MTLTSCRTVNRSVKEMGSGRLVLLKLLHRHVVRLGNDPAFRNLRFEGPAQPVGNEFGRDVIGQTALPLIVVSAVQEEFPAGSFVDQGTDQSPHDGENSWGADYENSEN